MFNKCLVLLFAVLTSNVLFAADTDSKPSRLPQSHPYQKTLRDFMATLKEADFQPLHQDLKAVPVDGDPAAQFRMWIMSLSPPSVGRKRNHSSVMTKAEQFTLASIESLTGVMRPPAYAEPLVDLAQWNYAGNPYFNSKPLRLRAFVLSALDMMMTDQLIEQGAETDKPNKEQFAGALLRAAYVYPGIREAIPTAVGDAYLVGLKKFLIRALEQGEDTPRRASSIFTGSAPALSLAARVVNDPDLNKKVESEVLKLFTAEQNFRPAGYFPHGGTLDSFNGISTYHALCAALITNGNVPREALAKLFRLKAHLTLPEPDGARVGPSHMAALTSAEGFRDQWWDIKNRIWMAAMVTDEAACLTKMPDETEIKNGAAAAVKETNIQLHELSWAPGGLDLAPWKFQASGSQANFGYQYYPADFYSRRASLEKQPLALLPVLRPENFTRNFADEFVVTKNAQHAAIVYTGPIADPSAEKPALGFGGGALSAFWTPKTGSVILGRGIGAWNPMSKKMYDEFRTFPTHAVLGITSEGKIFTSAHIIQPAVKIQASDKEYTITAQGTVPAVRADEKLLMGKIEYSRQFDSLPGGVRITTTLLGDGQDSVAELYEALPIFLRDTSTQRMLTPTMIEFQVDGKWISATEKYLTNVTAARLSRFDNAVEITFDQPRRVKLSPADWVDTYQTRVACRNLLIDLLENGDKPTPIRDAKKVSYRIEGK